MKTNCIMKSSALEACALAVFHFITDCEERETTLDDCKAFVEPYFKKVTEDEIDFVEVQTAIVAGTNALYDHISSSFNPNVTLETCRSEVESFFVEISEPAHSDSEGTSWIKRSSVGNYECPYCHEAVIMGDKMYVLCPFCGEGM